MRTMHIGAVVYLAAAFPAAGDGTGLAGTKSQLRSELLRHSKLYDEGRAGREVIARVRAGVYDNYNVELCIADTARCNDEVFLPYKADDNGKISYSAAISAQAWDAYPSEVQFEIVQEILFYTWGHDNREYSPLLAEIDTAGSPVSPLDFLSRSSAGMFASFARPEYLQGGLGRNAYGPNCWYNAISAITDAQSQYAISRKLDSGPWDKPRFMGPTEFRCQMTQFTEVSDPAFGDIVRYYVQEPIYNPGNNVFGGEVHAAVVVGDGEVSSQTTLESRRLVLTKNGRSDLDFLIYQDIEGLDSLYLGASDPAPAGPHIVKQFFRVKEGGSFFDPATAGDSAACYDAYLVDRANYKDRLECLAGRLDPPPGQDKSCYDYPENWLIGKDETAPATTDVTLPRLDELQELRVLRSQAGSG